MQSALDDVSRQDEVLAPVSAPTGVAENGENRNRVSEAAQVEARETRGVEQSEEEEAPESWTTYTLTNNDPATLSAAPQSPNVSEITPVEEGNKPEFLPTSAAVQISVSDPKRTEEVSKLGIRTSFTSYLVQSETSLPDYPFSKRAVWRRYKDFDTLHRLLRENHRGYIIPPLPSKNFIESKRGKDAFIKERQLELNKFLCQVVLHPALCSTEEMKVFLGCPEELSFSPGWQTLNEMAKQMIELPEKAGRGDLDSPVESMKRDVASVLKKVGNSIKREVMQRSYSVSDTERSLQDMVPKLKQLELQLGAMADKSQSFASLSEELGNELGMLGRVLLTMARFEETFVEDLESDAPLRQTFVAIVTVLHKAGYASVRVQQICTKSSVLLKAQLMTLMDHFNLLPSVLLALQDRTFVLRHLNDAQNRLENSRKALGNLARDSKKKLGGTPGYTNKAAILSQEIRSCVEEVSKRTELYDVATQRNLTELERHGGRRSQELADMTLAVAKIQQEYYEMISLVWVNLAEEIARTNT